MIYAIIQTSLARNTAFFLKLLVSMFIAAKYGAEGRGYIAAFILLPELISFFGSLSIKEGLLFYLAKRKISISTYRGVLLNIVLFQIPLMLIIAWFSIDYIEIDNGLFSVTLYYLLIPLLVFQEFNRFVLRGLSRISIFNLSIILEVCAYCTFAFYLIFVEAEIIYIVFSYMIGITVSIIFCQMHISKAFKDYKEKSNTGIREVYKYGLQVHLFNALNTLQAKYSALFISLYLTLSELGLFTVATTFAMVLQMGLQGPISTVVLPNLAKLDKESAVQFASQVTRTVTFVGVLYFFFMLFTGEYILVSLFGNEFAHAYYPMIFLILGMVLKTPMATLNCYFKASGEPKVLGLLAVKITPIQITLMTIIIPFYGILGAAIVASISSICFSYIVQKQYILSTGESFLDTIILKREDVLKFVGIINGQIKKYFA